MTLYNFMSKFIQTSISLDRSVPKEIKDKHGIVIRVDEERLTVTIEYIGLGNTTKITNSKILEKLMSFGDDILAPYILKE